MLLWLIVTSTIFLTTTSFTKSTQPDCSEIKRGSLSLKGEEVLSLGNYCGCSFESLTVRRASVINLPHCFSEKTITDLSIEYAELASLPEGILAMRSLEELSLKHTGLSFLPEKINQLKALRRLDLRGTNISSLPKGLDHLERIDLRMTDLKKADQTAIRDQYPTIKIFFSPPCNCK